MLLWGVACAAPLRVVTTTSDLAAVAREVCGRAAVVESLCRADHDPHSFEVTPQHVLKVQQADILLKVGLHLDLWADRLVASAANPKLRVVDCTAGVALIYDREEKSSKTLHPEGNPHYLRGPISLYAVARTIRDAASEADPSHAAYYADQCSSFTARLDSALAVWRTMLAACRGVGLVSAHPAWDYFARDFALEIIGVVGHVPEAEPAPSDLGALMKAVRAHGRVVFLREPFESDRLAQLLADETGLRVVDVPAGSEAQEVWSSFQQLVERMAENCVRTR